MNEDIMSGEEWCRRPTWHGSYDDYVKHVRGTQQYFREQENERNNQRIADLVVEKLTGRK